MVENSTATTDRLFRALASAPRREILRRVAMKPCSVTELAERFDMSLAAVSKHVRVLARADLLSLTREGRVSWCRLRPESLERARLSIDELHSFWDKRLDALERALRDDRSPRKGGTRRK